MILPTNNSNRFQQTQTPGRLPTPQPEAKTENTETLRFTEVMQGLSKSYNRGEMADISTSYGFICLLHLCNERGLTVTKTDALDELYIRKDPTAEITVGG